jgi:hypothetical protein
VQPKHGTGPGILKLILEAIGGVLRTFRGALAALEAFEALRSFKSLPPFLLQFW